MMWYVEFHHAYFGWLCFDERPFVTRQAAEQWARERGSPYPQRVIRTDRHAVLEVHRV
jgi:hypothetical protein